MKKTFGARLKALFGIKTIDENFFEELEDMLIEGDLGAATTMELSDALRMEAKKKKMVSGSELQQLMKAMLKEKMKTYMPRLSADDLNFFLILGVNGVGKTTTIAKMATYYRSQGNSVLLAAGDTFRAAAIDQLDVHAQRTQSRIVKQAFQGDPSAVLYDAIDSAKARKENLILADTAGRMHNKENLVRELKKMDKVVSSRIPDQKWYKKFLVIDATTGQNGLSQAQMFNDAVSLDAIILTKYDSAAKGGALVQICDKLGLPIAFVGVGEQYEDFREFDTDEFLDTLLGING
ncbi:MAG: signal recognition particle-docking protein FtsY [Sphaerochaetaceae bacterium]